MPTRSLLELIAKADRADLIRVIELALVHDPELEDILIAHLEEPFDRELEEFIDMHVIVDCYDEYEEISSWYAFLTQSLSLPFDAIWRREEATLEVVVFNLENDWSNILAEAKGSDGAVWSIPLEELELLEELAEREHALRVWKYWVRTG